MSTVIPDPVTDSRLFPIASFRERQDTPEYWEAQAEKLPPRAYNYTRYKKEAQWRRDPRVQDVYAGLISAGWPTGKLIPADRILNALNAGVPVDTLIEHFNGALLSYSRDGYTIDHAAMYGFTIAGHGVNFRLTPERIASLRRGEDIGVPNWRLGE